jgi:cytoskeletal protein CcmA (bactofilin family)
VKGPVYSKEIIIRETGSVTGTIEADRVEVHGHLDGKISGDDVIVGATGTVKGDISFANNLKTENGADIDGYIKKSNNSKSKLTGDFLFKKKDKKDVEKENQQETVVNKEALA